MVISGPQGAYGHDRMQMAILLLSCQEWGTSGPEATKLYFLALPQRISISPFTGLFVFSGQ